MLRKSEGNTAFAHLARNGTEALEDHEKPDGRGFFHRLVFAKHPAQTTERVVKIYPEHVTLGRKIVEKCRSADPCTLGNLLDGGLGVGLFDEKLQGSFLEHFR
jgi:hypothetical protein